MTEDDMVVWHYRFDGHVFEQVWELVMDRRPGMLQSMWLQRIGYD